MPRSLSSPFAAHLASGDTTLSLIVRVDRSDGTSYGYTSSSDPITYSGLTYQPDDFLQASTIESEAGSGVNNLDVEGIFSSLRMFAQDVLRGLYDDAIVTTSIINRNDVSMGAPILHRGEVGEITVEDYKFRSEVRGIEAWLKQKTGDSVSAACRCWHLGDLCCKKDLTSFRFGRTVATVSDEFHLTFSSTSLATGYFNFGIAKGTSGANSGIRREIKTHTKSGSTAVIELREAFPSPIAAGDTFELEAGCDRLPDTCKTKFNNLINFHGEKDIPGNDRLTEYGRQ